MRFRKSSLCPLFLIASNLFAQTDELNCCPTQPKGVGVYAFGDFLYWKATEDNLEEAAVFSHPTSSSNIDEINDVQFQYDPGFRVGAGCRSRTLDWDFSVLWTRFNTSADVSVGRTGTDTMILLYGQPGVQVQQVVVDTLNESWKLKYNMIDAVIVPGSLGDCSFAFEPFLAVRGVQIEQQLEFNFAGTFSPAPGTSGPATGDTVGKLKYRGIGPLLGFGMKRDIYWGFNFGGQVGASLVYGKSNLDQSQPSTVILPVVGVINTLDSFAETTYRWRANLQFAIRLDWEKTFYESGVSIGLRAGYEGLIWFNQNHFVVRQIEEGATSTLFDIRLQNGDLGMGGFTFGASLGF
jgi:hypothetical protein